MEGLTGAIVFTSVLAASLFFSRGPLFVREGEDGKDPFHAARHQLESAWQEKEMAMASAKDQVHILSKEAAAFAQHTVDDTRHFVKDKVEDAQAVAETVKDAVLHTKDSIVHKEREITNVVRESVGKATHSVGETAEAVIEAAMHTGAAAVDRARDAATATVHYAADVATHVEHKVEEGIEALEKQAVGVAHRAQQLPSQVIHTAKEAVCHQMDEFCMQGSQYHHDAARERLAPSPPPVAEKMAQAAADVADRARVVMGQVRETGKEATGDMKDLTRRVVDTVRPENRSQWSVPMPESPKGMMAQPSTTWEDWRHRVSANLHWLRGLTRDKGRRLPSLSKSVGLTTLRLAHLLAFAVAFGSSIWNLFFVGAPLAQMLSLAQFLLVQSQLFALYFKLFAVANGVAVITFALIRVLEKGGMMAVEGDLLEMLVLLLSFGCATANVFIVQPKATQLVLEKLQHEMPDAVLAQQRTPRQKAPVSTHAALQRTSSSQPATPPPSPDLQPLYPSADRLEGPLQALQRSSILVHKGPAVLSMVCLGALTWHGWNLVQVFSP